MSWSIDVPAARSILADAGGETATIDTAASDVATTFEGAIDATTDAPLTAAALRVVASDPLLMGLAAARRFVEEVTSAVGAAISHYEAGDLDMAAETQRLIPGEAQ